MITKGLYVRIFFIFVHYKPIKLYIMALLEIMKMKREDLEFLVEKHNGALGSTGTGSGSGCDGTVVHCCFPTPRTVKIQRARPIESPSGFKLVAGDCSYAIGLEE